MLLNINIVYTDGTTTNIDTDDSWKGTADGPIRANNEYDGEEYDATKEMPGWNKVGFDESKWLKAEFVQEPNGVIEAQMNENMKVMNTLKPVSISKLLRRQNSLKKPKLFMSHRKVGKELALEQNAYLML